MQETGCHHTIAQFASRPVEDRRTGHTAAAEADRPKTAAACATVRDTINHRLADHRSEVVRLERLLGHLPTGLLNCPIDYVRELAHPDLSII